MSLVKQAALVALLGGATTSAVMAQDDGYRSQVYTTPIPEATRPVRPYFGGGAGLLVWGQDSPGFYNGNDLGLFVSGGIRTDDRIRVGAHLSFSTVYFAAGPELGYALDKAGHFELVGRLSADVGTPNRELTAWGRDIRSSGTGYGLEAVWRPWAEAQDRHRSHWGLRFGYTGYTTRTSRYQEGSLQSKRRVTNIGWSLGLSYQR